MRLFEPLGWRAGIGLALCATALCAADGTLGIDVSHHSGEIDWSEVAHGEYGFVYLKATEGVDDADPLFEQHWQALEGTPLRRGAYHFYVTEDDPEEQARFFLSHVTLGPHDLPPVVDVELIGKGTSGDVAAKLQRFLDLVEQELGVTPMIYTDVDFWNEHFPATFGRYPLWVAEYGVAQPRVPHGWSRWHLWQFEEDATLPGVEKGADRSRLHPELDLDSLMVPAATATAPSD